MKYFLVFFAFLYFESEVRSEIIPVVMDSQHRKLVLLGKHIKIYIDSSQRLTPYEALKQIEFPNLQWDENGSPYNGNHLGEDFWMYFTIQDNDSSTDWFYLEIPDFHVNHIELYSLKNGVLTELGKQGFSESFQSRLLNYKNSMYIVSPREEGGYLVKMNSRLGSSYKIKVSHPSAKFDYAVEEYLWLGIYYGILSIMLLYNLLIFILTRERTYLLYVVYLAASIWYSFFTDGLGFQYLWSSLPELNRSYKTTSVLLLLSFVAYASEFLKLHRRSKRIYLILLVSSGLYIIVFLYNTWLDPLHQLSSWTFIIPYLVILYASVDQYIKGQKDVRFFILAYAFLLLSVVVHVLMRKEIFPDNVYGIYALNLGFILEAIFLSLAQGDRIRLEKNERMEAQNRIIEQQEENKKLQEKVNRELESLVAQRTHELNNKNKELEESNDSLLVLQEQVNRMNAKLDKDNWELKKVVKESSKQKVLENSVTYEEFLKVFPDEFSCYKYLENLKWGEHFECKKCGNEKWNSAISYLHRKCTRCNTKESITAHTLLHRIHFPIHKAYYIALVVFKKVDITNKELASEIELRLDTCATFRKRAEQKMEAVEVRGFDDLLT